MCKILRQEQQQQQETVWLGTEEKKNVMDEDGESRSLQILQVTWRLQFLLYMRQQATKSCWAEYEFIWYMP